MVTTTYDYYYGLSGVNLSTGTVTVPFIPPISVTTTLSDTEDGTDDGILAIGAELDWSAITSQKVVLAGATTEGYPIVQNDVTGHYFLLTPVNGLHNQTFTVNTTDPFTFCYAAGTQIATPQGERNVEDLKIGDLVSTVDGRNVPVLWLGHQTIHKCFKGWKGQLVRIRAGAFGKGLPHSDLLVTGDHGMVLDGLVINASALVNGDTIDWVPLADFPDSYSIYHIETEAHEVILANGAASETFIDCPGRQGFDNYAEYLDLYGVERIVPELKMLRLVAARLVPAHISDRLAAKTAPSAGVTREVKLSA